MANTVSIFPKGFQLEYYKYVLSKHDFYTSYRNTILITVFGTALSMLFTVLAAYPLSKPWLRGRKFLLMLFVFSMIFYGGIVPSYMLMKVLGLIDSLWALIVPFLLAQFNMLVIKSYMEGLPVSIEESAEMDGAGPTRILFSIVLPMCLPVLASMTLFYAVGYWNNYFHARMFISSPEKRTLQLYLNDLIISATQLQNDMTVEDFLNLSPGGVRAATIFAATLPILLFYPYLQKYFVTGITIGSVKG
jgi:putative aldouronate transport system permease protein